MRVIALRNFKDLKAGVRRVEGDVFTVSKERFDEIMAKGSDLIAAFEQEQEPKPEEAQEPEAKAEAPKRTTRKRSSAKKNG